MIKLIVVGKVKEKYFTDAIKEYEKRLSKYTKLNIIEVADCGIEEIDKSLKTMNKSLDEQKEVNLKQIRHTIVHTCEDALEKGEISINKLRSLEEMYDEYVDIFHGNGYVKTLVMRVRKLKIVGKLDD